MPADFSGVAGAIAELRADNGKCWSSRWDALGGQIQATPTLIKGRHACRAAAAATPTWCARPRSSASRVAAAASCAARPGTVRHGALSPPPQRPLGGLQPGNTRTGRVHLGAVDTVRPVPFAMRVPSLRLEGLRIVHLGRAVGDGQAAIGGLELRHQRQRQGAGSGRCPTTLRVLMPSGVSSRSEYL